MDDPWSELDAKYGLKPAGESNSPDSWEALDAKLLKPTATQSTKAQATRQSDFTGNLQFATPFGTIDTKIQLPSGVNEVLAQFGSGIADWGLAGRQMLAPKDSLSGEAKDKRALDALLNDSYTGKALNFAGKVAPAIALPNVGGPLVSGVLGGMTVGAFEPTIAGESRTSNVGIGGAAGAIVPGVVAGFRKMALPDAATSDLARSAIAQGIPIGTADVSTNRFLKAARSVLNDTPFIGAIGNAQNASKQAGFNAAVGDVIGANAPSLTPQVFDAAGSRIKYTLNRIWDNNNLKMDGQFINDLNSITSRAHTDLLPEQAVLIDKQIQKLLSKANNAEIPGTFTNNWQSELRLAVDGEKGLAKQILSDLRKSVLGVFNRSVSGQDAMALTGARTQYGAWKTLQPLLTKGEAGIAGRASGDVPAASFGQRVIQQYGDRASPFGDLPAIGNRFIVDRTAQTGGSPRALIQNSLIGSALMGGGYAGGGAVGAAGPAALAGGTQWLLGSPTVAKSLLSQGGGRGLLSSPQLTPTVMDLLQQGALRIPPAMAPGLLGLSPFLE